MKSTFLVSKGLLCLYDKQNNTWLLVDMEFLFSCSTRHLTRSLHSLLSYRVEQRRIFIKLPRCLESTRDVSRGKSLLHHFLHIADFFEHAW